MEAGFLDKSIALFDKLALYVSSIFSLQEKVAILSLSTINSYYIYHVYNQVNNNMNASLFAVCLVGNSLHPRHPRSLSRHYLN